ncbi:MAG: Rne/Rng family ribonuclease [Propionibacteriaceae bacterium]|nr:Rne/Rng family ribonuclease [Propionibacteriaceae bacterium]
MLDSDTAAGGDIPPTTSTTRRRSASRPAGPPDATPVSDQEPKPARARRRPATEATEVTAQEKPATTRRRKVAAAADEPQAQASAPAGLKSESTAPEAAAKPVRRRRTTKAQAAETVEPPAVVAATVEKKTSRRARKVAADTPLEAAEPETPPVKKRASRTANSRKAAAEAAPDLDAVAAAITEAEATAKPARTRRKTAQLAAFGLVAESPDQVLESLAAAISGTAETVDASANSAQSEPSQDGSDPHPRRRRRGGRRRRRTGAETEIEAEVEKPAESQSADSDAHGTEVNVRRRRRRRRGEDATEGDDDPKVVSVRIRDPKPATPDTNEEVAGIEGSTRVEAKKQRRREGRSLGRRRSLILSESEFLARRESVDRTLLIRQTETYSQLAVLEDGILVEHYVDQVSHASMIGNIYLGKVQNVLPSMEAAFIDIGRGRNAVLYAGEVDWDAFGEEGAEKKIEQVFQSGQSVIVQVSKDPVGAKGARLTAHLSLPGRYLVYSPGGHLSGISRKLPEPERRRLKEILDNLIDPQASVIIRTAAEGAVEEELVHDVNRLKAQWEVISKKAETASPPKLLYTEPDLTVRIVRDLFTEDFSSLVVDGSGAANDAWETVDAYVAHVAGHLRDRLLRWRREEQGDLFDHYRIQEQVAKALERKVFLPSGGSLIIDRTEAMTVIDVNTGKFTGTQGNLEATVTSNNLEAAEEIVRQLRLRDIGGIVVIDFIDMVLSSNRELLLRRLVECLSRDRTRHQVAEVTSLGLVQLTRKKIGTGLAEAFTVACETCHGRGYHTHDVPVPGLGAPDGGYRDQRHQKSKRHDARSDKPKKKNSSPTG